MYLWIKDLRSESQNGKRKSNSSRRRLSWLNGNNKAAETGTSVELFSLVPVKRSHSVCAQGGINGAVNTKGEGDSPCDPL